MGNKGLKQKLEANNSRFLCDGEGYKLYLHEFYDQKVPGTQHEKFKLFEDIIDDNENLQKLFEKLDLNLPINYEGMCSQDGFFLSLTED